MIKKLMQLPKKLLKDKTKIKRKFVFLLVFFCLYNRTTGQNCFCDKYLIYSDTCIKYYKKDTCYKQCNFLAQRISIIYKLYDISNQCNILPSKITLNDLFDSKEKSFTSKEIRFFNYLQMPFSMNFFQIETYKNDLILKSSIQIQKVIINTQEIFDSCDHLYYGCLDCEKRVVNDDTIYIDANYIFTKSINFIGSRVYFSSIKNQIRDEVYNQLFEKGPLNKDEFKKFTTIYTELLKLRHVNYEIATKRNNSMIVKIKQPLFFKEIILNHKNIRECLINLIVGGLAEQIWK